MRVLVFSVVAIDKKKSQSGHFQAPFALEEVGGALEHPQKL